MALAAAHFECVHETVDTQKERAMLDWLSTLSPPSMVVPKATTRDVLTVYVPVNDQKSEDALVKRSRQPRFFPRVHVGDEELRLIYESDASEFAAYASTLESLCKRVTRIGHSSSLVWVRVDADEKSHATHVPDEFAIAAPARVVSAGATARLESAYNGKAVERYAQMQSEMSAVKGAAKKKLAASLTAEFSKWSAD